MYRYPETSPTGSQLCEMNDATSKTCLILKSSLRIRTVNFNYHQCNKGFRYPEARLPRQYLRKRMCLDKCRLHEHKRFTYLTLQVFGATQAWSIDNIITQ